MVQYSLELINLYTISIVCIQEINLFLALKASRNQFHVYINHGLRGNITGVKGGFQNNIIKLRRD